MSRRDFKHLSQNAYRPEQSGHPSLIEMLTVGIGSYLLLGSLFFGLGWLFLFQWDRVTP